MSQNLSSAAVVIGALKVNWYRVVQINNSQCRGENQSTLKVKYDTKIDSTVYENLIDTLSNKLDQISFLDHLTKGQVHVFAGNPDNTCRWKLELLLAGNKRSIKFQFHVNTSHIAVCVIYPPSPLNILKLNSVITRFGAFDILSI